MEREPVAAGCGRAENGQAARGWLLRSGLPGLARCGARAFG